MHKRVILGTAGHIDHGKTSLVRALTGIDTDRLKEEKRRGITIELGFAHLELPGGTDLAIVDVPGHERFVKNMVAGAAGIDFVLLVVAADEGVMPQTREHLDICSLLGIRHGLIALTKADAVDEEFLELAREDVEELVAGTFLEGAPVVPVSAVTGQGLPELVAHLDRIAAELPQRGSKGLFRLPVDRVFTMRGFGTVATGTLISGAVDRDEEVEVLPRGLRAKVRGLQVHGKAVDRALAGQRTAVNLAGVDVDQLARGDTLIRPGTLAPTRMVDAKLRLLPSAAKPLASRSRVRFHSGTQEVPVVVALLGREELSPGEEGFVQIRAPGWMVVCPGDRFVLRAFSPAVTLGGGVVLDQRPRKHKGRHEEVLHRLEVLDRGTPGERLRVLLEGRGLAGMDPGEVQASLGVSVTEARRVLQAAVREGWAVVTDRKAQRHHHEQVVDELARRALDLLTRFHEASPLKRGLGVEELRTKFPRYVGPRLVEFVLERLRDEGKVAVEGELVRRSDFTVRLSADDESLRRRILDVLAARGYEAPSVDDVAQALGEDPAALKPVLDYLVGQGMLTRTKEGFYFDSASLQELARQVVALFQEQAEIGVADIKRLTGTTRKYTIPLLEYLDGQKITARRGDVRVAGPRGRA
ncbi:MAG: selenocysteine-specific translation elongation factor [Deferrisomatales bacterium]